MKKNCYLLFFLAIIVAAFSCTKKVTYPEYFGTWKRVDTPSSKKVLCEDGKYKALFYDTLEFSPESNAKYELNYKEDTVWMTTVYHNISNGFEVVRKFHSKEVLFLNGDFITNITYKAIRGPLKNHIDEYGVWVRDVANPKKLDYSGKRITYVFPKNFKGAAWIAFNQPNGVAPEFDSQGNPILRIPENGILETKLHEDAFATANGHYSIVKDDGEKFIPFKTFDKFDRFDSTCCERDEYYAFMQGFNQKSRDDINENIFRKSITGNVLAIYIGKYQWFEKNELHPWDSEMD